MEPDFTPTTWATFRRLVLDEKPPADVVSEFGLSLHAVLLVKSRVLKSLRERLHGLID
jgi:hypothetical protein